MIENNKKILICVPAETSFGGIKNYYKVLKNKFELPVEYIIRGSRKWPHRENNYKEFIRFFSDIFIFRKKIKSGKYNLIQTSTSLGLFSVIRDALYLFIAKKNNVKTIVFFRGWDKNFEYKIERSYLKLFRKYFFTSDLFIVLSPEFKNTLTRWGYNKEIKIESTLIDEKLLNQINFENLFRIKNEKLNKEINILFLARIEIEKGVYETINSFSILQDQLSDYDLNLIIAGDGLELNELKKYINKINLNRVSIVGNIEGNKKADLLSMADLYIFPTYTEGMPNSVLEAMAFGLPIIAGEAGAIPYIISEGVNGYVTKSSDPSVISSLLNHLILNKELRIEIGKNNFIAAKENYYSSKVIKRLESIFKEIITAN
jgi:glycosyltransferase involved in cell wall biosynthesis